MPKHELILLKNMMQPGYTGSLQEYERAGGYQALRKIVGKVPPTEVTSGKEAGTDTQAPLRPSTSRNETSHEADPESPERKRMFALMGSINIPLVMEDTRALLAYAEGQSAARVSGSLIA